MEPGTFQMIHAGRVQTAESRCAKFSALRWTSRGRSAAKSAFRLRENHRRAARMFKEIAAYGMYVRVVLDSIWQHKHSHASIMFRAGALRGLGDTSGVDLTRNGLVRLEMLLAQNGKTFTDQHVLFLKRQRAKESLKFKFGFRK